MELTKEEEKTIKYYDENALTWAQKHGLSGDKELMFQPEMELLFKLVPQGKILEIGTGHGGDAIQLVKHYGLNNYVGVDASGGLLRIAKERNPKADLRLANVFELDFPKESFDGFWISAMLIHIPKNKLNEALSNVHLVTKKGGVGFVSIMEGTADMEESRPGRYFSLWGQDEFTDELLKAGFETLHKRRIDTDASSWMTYLIKRK